jgi:hypothetical protein
MAHPKCQTKQPRRVELKTVPASRCHQRILALSKHGVGRKAIHEHTGLDHRTLARIRNGQTKYVRCETRDLIFSVPFDGHCDKALIDAKPTWKMIDRMLRSRDMGFTRSEIAKRIGHHVSKSGFAFLQIGKTKVLARTQMRVEKLYKDAVGL